MIHIFLPDTKIYYHIVHTDREEHHMFSYSSHVYMYIYIYTYTRFGAQHLFYLGAVSFVLQKNHRSQGCAVIQSHPVPAHD